MSDPYDLSSGGKGLKVQPCHCPYHRKLREEEAQGPRPGWLQREFDAARKAAAPPAADSWIKIEPGGEMPEDGKRVLLRFPSGKVWCGSLYRHAADGAWQWHCDKDRSRGWTGFSSKGGPTHYAVVRMPED